MTKFSSRSAIIAEEQYDNGRAYPVLGSGTLAAVIAEAAARISDEVTDRYARIPWPQIVALRNILIHAYFGSTEMKFGRRPR